MLFDWIGASVPVDVESIDWSAVPIRSDLQPLHDRRGREVRADPRLLARREACVSLPSVASRRRGSGVTGTWCSAGAGYSSITSVSLAEARLLTLLSEFLVSSCTSSLAWSR